MNARRPNTTILLAAAAVIGTAAAAALGGLAGYTKVLTWYDADAAAADTALAGAITSAPIGALAGFLAGVGTIAQGATLLSGFEWALITGSAIYLGLAGGFRTVNLGSLGLVLAAIPATAAWLASALTRRLLGHQQPRRSMGAKVLAGYFAAFAVLALGALTCVVPWLQVTSN